MNHERPLRILHLLAGSDAGGISRYLLDLCGAMRGAGHDVLLAGERGAWHAKFEAARLPWVDVSLKGGYFALRQAAAMLRSALAERPVDVIHAHYRRASLVGRKVQAARGSPPLLYTLHLSHMPMSWGRRWLSDFGDHTHVASRQAERWLVDERLVPAERITYVPHGVDPQRFPIASDEDRGAARRALGLPIDAAVAAYVGRLDYPKNEEWLLDVAERAGPNVRVVFAGDGPHEASLRAEIGRRRLRDRVTLLGHQDDPLPVYRAADAVLLPSLREGFSYVTAEAMSVGTPVLRTRTSGSEELIVDGQTGRITPIERAAFVAATVDFLSDRRRLRAMGAAAARHVRGSFTLDQQIAATTALYRRLASS